MTDEKVERLARERANHLRNAAGWRAQLARRGAGNYPADDLLAEIEKAEQEAVRLAGEIVRLLDVDRHERERAARRKHADQAARIGKSLPGERKE